MMRCEPRLLDACRRRSNKGPNVVSNPPTSNAIEIRLTLAQKEHYFRRTGMVLHSVSVPPAQLRRFSGVAARAGSESLPIPRSAGREPAGARAPGGGGGRGG